MQVRLRRGESLGTLTAIIVTTPSSADTIVTNFCFEISDIILFLSSE